MSLITENQLDAWVRANATIAQGKIVELVWRLVCASVPNPEERRFPLGDSIGQSGADGLLTTDRSFETFVPEGQSHWEIGTGINPSQKATDDYRKSTKQTLEKTRLNSTFIFLTPLSGVRVPWIAEKRDYWIARRKKKADWKDVRVIDGTELIDWLHQFPAVERWMAGVMGQDVGGFESLEEHWNVRSKIGDPPPLTPDLFLANRKDAQSALVDFFDNNKLAIQIETHDPEQVLDFVAAHIASLESAKQHEWWGRSLIVFTEEAWRNICTLKSQQVLIAGPDLNIDGSRGTTLLELAKQKKHQVVYRSQPGGIYHPNSSSLPAPGVNLIQKALQEAGYLEELARVVAIRSGGDLSVLLRQIQNLALDQTWAQHSRASDLAIATLLGSWNDGNKADHAAEEQLSKKAYGEWIEALREIASLSGTPLRQKNGAWKFASRYEAWTALGSRLYDEHLDDFLDLAKRVLGEKDPKFELEPDQRFAAQVYGKELKHSAQLRSGLAETLALLGNHGEALKSCSQGKAKTIAHVAVREILRDADWHLWASIDSLLPLLAEAAPGAFLEEVENTLLQNPCPFDRVFSLENQGVWGRNYITGLLRALETLAWEKEYLTRVLLILAELAERDPGGTYANRPARSLGTILLPWYPQTCASIEKRKNAVQVVLREHPKIGWDLLFGLLPQSSGMSMPTRRPIWRWQAIPDNWSTKVTQKDYYAQIVGYADLLMEHAANDPSKLSEIIKRLKDLPEVVRNQFIERLDSDAILAIPESQRLPLWNELVDLITMHKRVAEAKWAMPANELKKLEAVAKRLEPNNPYLRHQRLFRLAEFELYEERGNYQEQRAELNKRRVQALVEIEKHGGFEEIKTFAESVESPYGVGLHYAKVANAKIDKAIVPSLLDEQQQALYRFAGGFIDGRFAKGAWSWVNNFDMTDWSADDIARFLIHLPFIKETWARVEKLLGKESSLYWQLTPTRPYQALDDLEIAIDALLEVERSASALACLNALRHDNRTIQAQQAQRTLLDLARSETEAKKLDQFHVTEIIENLQADPKADIDKVRQIEWIYLPLLQFNSPTWPIFLEHQLATEPAFFCKILRMAYKPEKGAPPETEQDSASHENAKAEITRAWDLLRHWRAVPGTQNSDAFSPQDFSDWMHETRKLCREAYREGMAQQTIGAVLIHAPTDPDGFWIHNEIAGVLDAIDAKHLRDGLFFKILNARGGHVFSNGREERTLAAQYREQAEKTDNAGFSRLATMLREVAKSYERDAERDASMDIFDE